MVRRARRLHQQRHRSGTIARNSRTARLQARRSRGKLRVRRPDGGLRVRRPDGGLVCANNRAFLPRLDKTCVYSRTLRPEEAFPQRIKTQYGDKLPPAEEAIHYSLLNGRQPLASSTSSGCGASGTLRGRSTMCPDSPKRPLRGALKPIRVLQADALGDALGT